MKQNNLWRKGITMLTVALATAGLASCSSEELAGEPLPDGKYPLELKATGMSAIATPETRATVDGDWKGVTTVAVQVGTEVKEYTASSTETDGNKTAKLSSTDPFYWQNKNDITVSAWWPYVASTYAKPDVVIKSDQGSKANYDACDFIEANQTVSFGNPTLLFTHRTAKICVVLNPGKGFDADYDLSQAKVSVVVGDGIDNTISTYHDEANKKHLALIVPQKVEESKLVVKIVLNGVTFSYTSTQAYDFKANTQYAFTLNISKTALTLSGNCKILSWGDEQTVTDGSVATENTDYYIKDGVYYVNNADGLYAWAAAMKEKGVYDISCTLAADIELPAAPADGNNWETVASRWGETYTGTFDGNGKTITNMTINKENSNNLGFIGANEGNIRNLTLDKANINTTSITGAVVGSNTGTIDNCHVTESTITAMGITGGIVGQAQENFTMSKCSVSADCVVKSISSIGTVGGIVGDCGKGAITACYALCKIESQYYAGGIAASIYQTSVDACYYNGDISAGAAGAIIGRNDKDTSVSNCYWAVNGESTVAMGVSYGTDNTTHVAGTTDNTWTTATTEMNTAAEAAITDWQFRYKQTDGEDNPPTLVKK